MVDVKQLSKKEDMSQVLGCIMLKTELLFDRDYTLKPNYFIQEYALVFSCMSNLIKQGVKHFDDKIISEYMKKHLNNFYDIYKDINEDGDFIKNILEGTKFNNLDYHYNQVKKMAYLRDISKNVDISFIYDISGEDKELNKEFDKMNFKEVVNKFKILVNKIDETWTEENKDNKESMSSESISDDILDDVLEGNVEVGHKFPMGLEALTYIYRGQLPQKYNLNMAGSGAGK